MTETLRFGSGNREGHDASKFYDRGLAKADEDLKTLPVESPVTDQLWVQDSTDMHQLVDNSVALMVTSPPYHVGKVYDTDQTFEEYLDLLYRVFAETYRVLEPGGRAAINVAGLGRKPYLNLGNYVDQIMLDIGYFPRGEIIWKKGEGASGSCAWGSFKSAANPVLRDIHEKILVYSKGRFSRAKKGVSTISKEEFMEYTLSIWNMRPESAKKVKHPAPFPVELPRRLIELYTYEGDLVLDPFVGVGSTAVAAKQTGRHYVGYDLDVIYDEEGNPSSAGYIDLANQRLEEIHGGQDDVGSRARDHAGEPVQ